MRPTTKENEMPRSIEMTEEQGTYPGGRVTITEWAYGWKSYLTDKWHYRSVPDRKFAEDELADLLANRGIGGDDVIIMSRQRVVEVSEWYKR
jgi:hypothetical protein